MVARIGDKVFLRERISLVFKRNPESVNGYELKEVKAIRPKIDAYIGVAPSSNEVARNLKETHRRLVCL